MAKLNKAATSPFVSTTETTHEGAPAATVRHPIDRLRRLTLAHLLWEDGFYVDGKTAADQVVEAVKACDPNDVSVLACEARTEYKLRHIPLLLVRELARHPKLKTNPTLVSATLDYVIQRPDELTEFLAIYQKDGKDQPLSAQVKKGLASAFRKFDAYQFAKYDRDTEIKLRDVMFLTHPKPSGPKQSKELFTQIATRTLPTPDTWEVGISAAKGDTVATKAEWERLLAEGKLGGLALIRNLRNMWELGISKTDIRNAITGMKTDRILPFRFIAAARVVPDLEPELEIAMAKCLAAMPKFPGKTVLLVDVSGSMDAKLSGKSDLMRVDAACGLAMLLRDVCEDVKILTFSDRVVSVPPRHGFALRDSINKSQAHSGTQGFAAVEAANREGYDRLVCITDEQWYGRSRGYSGSWYSPVVINPCLPNPKARNYMLNVGVDKNGVGYENAWQTVTGWSEGVVRYIAALEGEGKE